MKKQKYLNKLFNEIDNCYSKSRDLVERAHTLEQRVTDHVYKEYSVAYLNDLMQVIESSAAEFEIDQFHDIYKKYHNNKLEMQDCKKLNSLNDKFSNRTKYKEDKMDRLFDIFNGGELDE